MIKCCICGKELKGEQKRLCSTKCRDKEQYLKFRDKKLANSKRRRERNKDNPIFKEYHNNKSSEWYKHNKDRQRENVKRDYYKNKIKWQSRQETRVLLREGKIYLNRICKQCKNQERLQIHHEIYPTKRKEIIKAVKEGKIYYLCKICHLKEKAKFYKA